MLTHIKSLKEDSFIKHNIVLFCGSMVVAVFNYLYHPVMGRMLSVEDFGEVQTLISLFLQITIIGGVFRTMVINVVSNYGQKDAEDSVLALYKVATYVILLLSLSIIAVSPLLQSFFNFHSAFPFVILAVILLTGNPITFGEALLQGKRKFLVVSVSQSIVSVGKLFFAIIFVYVGWSSLGAISGIIVAQILSILYLRGKVPKIFALRNKNVKIGSRIRKNAGYALLVLVVSFATSFLFSFDTLAVKHYFSAETAGFYGGVAIIARIIYFATASIAGVLLPSVKIDDPDGQNARLLTKSLILIAVVGGAIYVTFALFPEFIIGTMLGRRYLIYASLLPMLCLVFFLISIINLLFSYMLAVRNYGAALVSLIGIMIIPSVSVLHHASLVEIIENSLFASITVIILLTVLYFTSKKQRARTETP